MTSGPRPLVPGLLVTPTIRLVRPLGQGTMGSIWLADHLGLETQVVVKFMAAELLDDAVTRARFEREATLAARAKSPHVVQVFDHGVTADGLPYIAMELLEGEDLGHRLKRDLVIEPRLFADWLTQVCKGIGRVHANDVVHRDLKPANIFLCDHDGETLVKVLDFGVAKGETSGNFHGTATNVALGTPLYMSPEQMAGSKNVDHRADLWALGVVTYRALTGKMPFDGDVIGALVLAVTLSPARPPSQHRPSLPRAVDGWMEKALAKKPGDRFQSAREMALAFVEAVGGDRLPASSSDASSPGSAGPIAGEETPISRAAATFPVIVNAADFSKPVDTASATTSELSANDGSGSTLRRRMWMLALGLVFGAVASGAIVVRFRDAFAPAPSSSPAAPIASLSASPSDSSTTRPAASNSAPTGIAVTDNVTSDASVPTAAATSATPRAKSPRTKTRAGATKATNPLEMPLQ